LTPIIIFADRRNTGFLTKASEKKVHKRLRIQSYGDTKSAELLFLFLGPPMHRRGLDSPLLISLDEKSALSRMRTRCRSFY
jgi:hypothetical protein